MIDLFVAIVLGLVLGFLIIIGVKILDKALLSQSRLRERERLNELITLFKGLSLRTLNNEIKDYYSYINLVNQLYFDFWGEEEFECLSSLNQVCASIIVSIDTGKLEYGSKALFQGLQIILELYSRVKVLADRNKALNNALVTIKDSFFNKLFQLYTSKLIQNYKEHHVRSTSLQVIQMIISFCDQALSQHAYNNILDLLSSNPADKGLKTLALDFGRYYYGSLRPDGVITIYDEQAIQNDISVRMEH